jgi:hypothetical protein
MKLMYCTDCGSSLLESGKFCAQCGSPRDAGAKQPVQEAPIDPNAIVVEQSGNGQFRTISEAIAAAAPDSTIIIRSGEYEEDVTIDKPLELIGYGSTSDVVISADEDYCIALNASRATLRNLTIRGGLTGIQVEGGELTVADCNVGDAIYGICVDGDSARAALVPFPDGWRGLRSSGETGPPRAAGIPPPH